MFRVVRQRINLAKPELWLVPGNHYYVVVFIIVLMSTCIPAILLAEWQSVLAKGWYGILNLGFHGVVSLIALACVLNRIPALVRFDVAHAGAMQVVRRETRALVWMAGTIGLMAIVGFIVKRIFAAIG